MTRNNPNSRNKSDQLSSTYKEESSNSTMDTDDVLTEDPEFPSFISKGNDFNSLYRDVNRKKSEMKNSTLGGLDRKSVVQGKRGDLGKGGNMKKRSKRSSEADE